MVWPVWSALVYSRQAVPYMMGSDPVRAVWSNDFIFEKNTKPMPKINEVENKIPNQHFIEQRPKTPQSNRHFRKKIITYRKLHAIPRRVSPRKVNRWFLWQFISSRSSADKYDVIPSGDECYQTSITPFVGDVRASEIVSLARAKLRRGTSNNLCTAPY